MENIRKSVNLPYQKTLDERNKFIGKDIKDFGFVHHSAYMGNDPELKEIDVVIIDEAHRMKNIETQFST